MTSTTRDETRIEADPNLPTIRIIRDFAAPRARVFRAWIDPDLATRWVGPASVQMTIEHWQGHTGGSYRYTHWRDGERLAGFYGSFHEVRPDERLVQTFTYDGVPDGVSLETATFEDLPDGGTRVTVLAVVENMIARDQMLASGMEHGIREGYATLDDLLAAD
ncbi:SRPBCC family protein [Solwaraspora sp. WMMD791]|uniref:SRPBCC family protein n=1 Tax=Solwaraspora sp. WMMD791 TaxID=3016086 RepID=UPI00249AE825|nr:SRPBCC family protein [Solwaraspora sp. WMMD791]WFE27539.1 SRPBCC family protein [Solwaraspora sp. WMMD791]